MRNRRQLLLLAAAMLAFALTPVCAQDWDEDEEEPKTQALEILPDPPLMRTVETSRLVFKIAPLSPQGLLSKQVRNSLKTLFKLNGKARIVHLRAFVAGSGDTRRVQAVVSEVFAKKKHPLPSLSVVQVGPLPAQGAQVVLESVAESRRPVNPNGLAFLSGQAVATGEAVLEVAPVAIQSLEKIRSAANALGMDPATDVLRVTCYCSSLQDGAAVRKAMAAAFPAAALNHLQLRRVYTPASVNCEAVSRIKKSAGEPLRFFNPDGLSGDDGQSQVALVEADRILMSGSQLAFRGQESDIRLALERMGQSLDEHGSSYHRVVIARYYTLAPVVSNSIRKMRWDFFDQTRPPAVTMVELEGLPSLDASFAMDVIAVAGH